MTWRRADVLWRVAPGYLALSTVDGQLLEVRGPGADVWDELSEPREEAELCAAVAQRYGVDADSIAADVTSLLVQLQAGGYAVSSS